MAMILSYVKWIVGCTCVHKIAYRHARLINNIKRYRMSLAYLDRFNYLSFDTLLSFIFSVCYVSRVYAGRFNFRDTLITERCIILVKIHKILCTRILRNCRIECVQL